MCGDRSTSVYTHIAELDAELRLVETVLRSARQSLPSGMLGERQRCNLLATLHGASQAVRVATDPMGVIT
ncbi:hypothetical protein [Sciscionella marina]|uniref:hypothetical protein n=1 Tax=Sciscionella marina TaxID=508770 RepID=UPI000361C912|nr:hypothetical protein [Sciscionella marina]